MADLDRTFILPYPECTHPLSAPCPVFSQVISPEKTEPTASPEGIQMELDEEMENDICKVWDMSMDEVGVMCGSRPRGWFTALGGFCPVCSVGALLEVGEGTELYGLGQLSDLDGIDYSVLADSVL